MSDTNSNAYRLEAAEKRAQIAALAAEANDLEAKADAIDNPTSDEVASEETVKDTSEAKGEETESENKKSRFSKN